MLELADISKSYGKKEVLKHLNLKISEGDFICIKGLSGEGKSTLLNILGLFDTVTSGQYLIDGIDVTAQKNLHPAFRSEKFGFVFQAYHLIEDLTVTQNVELPLMYSQKKNSTDKNISALLEQFGIESIRETVVKKLSGGEKQRVAFVRAIVNNPAYLLCDEPTGNLDSKNAKVICEFLGAQNQSGKTVVLITHDDSVIEKTLAFGAKVYEIKQKEIHILV